MDKIFKIIYFKQNVSEDNREIAYKSFQKVKFSGSKNKKTIIKIVVMHSKQNRKENKEDEM